MTNKILSYTLLLLLTAMLGSCEKDLPLYDEQVSRINFYYPNVTTETMDSTLTRTAYSFVFDTEDVKADTVWLEVETMGFVADHDRAVKLVQVDTTANNAVPGKHYVAFDDPALSAYYQVPAGKARAQLPVVLLRDVSLKDTSVVLKIRLAANDEFQPGYPAYQTRVITFSDRLSEPSAWSKPRYYDPNYPEWGTYTLSNYFGAYGPVKHRFLIETTGKKWDNDYIEELINGDSNYLTYLIQELQKDLDALNEKRKAQGLDVLKEADGTPVVIQQQ